MTGEKIHGSGLCFCLIILFILYLTGDCVLSLNSTRQANQKLGNTSGTEKQVKPARPKLIVRSPSVDRVREYKNSSKCLPMDDPILSRSYGNKSCIDYRNDDCYLDEVCVFYGDCCSSYRDVKSHFNKVDCLGSIFNETKSYTRLLKVYELYRWFKLATCEQTLNTYLVTQCSEEDDVSQKVNDLLHKLNHPAENGSLYFGLSLPDVTSRCHGVISASDVTINSVPVTLQTGTTMVDFRNVFCAICNGLDPATVKQWGASLICHNTSTSIFQMLVQKNNLDNDWCTLELTSPHHARSCSQPKKKNPGKNVYNPTAISNDRVSSFRHLFDLNSYSASNVDENCGQNQIFAPIYQKCLEITCPEGSDLIGRACMRTGMRDTITYDNNVSHVMETYNMTLPTPASQMGLYIWFKYLLADNRQRCEEYCFSEANNGTNLENPVQQMLSRIIEPNTRHTVSLQYFTLVWTTAMLGTGSINRTEMTSNLLDELKSAFKNTFSAKISIIQVNASRCLDVHRTGQDDDSPQSGMCVLVRFNMSTLSDTDSLMSNIKTTILTRLNDIAHESNFLVKNVTLTNQANELITRGDQFCTLGRKLIFKEMSLVTDQNGTDHVDLNLTTLPLKFFIFYLHYSGDSLSRDNPKDKATVGWCDNPVLKCPYVYVNSSEIVEFQNYLLVTKHSDEIKSYLLHYSNSSISLDELRTICEELFKDQRLSILKNGDYVLTDNGALVCFDELKLPQTVIPNSEAERVATLIACGISVSCLVVVLLVYSLVPELRNVPGKIVMSMSSALLVAQMMFLFCTHPQGLACEIYAAVHHAVWLASFAWLAAMSLHLACILHVQSQHWFNPSSSAIFYVFSSLCWGLPSLIAGSGFILDKTGTVQINYGKNGVCWIGNFKSIIAVFIVPMFLLLSINAMCAVFVIKAIRKSSNFRQKNSQHKREKTQLVLCVNLSLMMGLTWLFYFLAIAINTSYMWIVFILTNGSQGLYVFLCYLARKSVLVKLIGMLRRFKPTPPNITDAIDLTRSTTLWTLPLTDQVPRFSPRSYLYTVNP